MEDQINVKSAEEVVADAYVNLSRYTAKTRNYPSLIDGMKMAYKRLIYQSRKYNSRVKSATLVGEMLKIHPHGDESAYSVLVECTCKYNNFPLFNGKGNFGGLGFGPSAMRYTEAVLSDIARLMYLDLIDYAEYEEGEVGEMEPKYLPALIPYCFLEGCSGFSVGMPAPNIPPMNALDLVNYYINLLENKKCNYPAPDYGSVVLDCDRVDHSDYLMKNGSGTLWFEPFIIQEDYNKFVVTQVTPNSNMGKVNKRLAWAIDQGWVDFSDETNEDGYRFVYVINNLNKISVDEVRDAINKGLHCSMSYRYMFEYNSTVYACNFDYVVKYQMKYLRECVIRKFKDYFSKSEYKSKVLEAINKLRSNEEIVSTLYKKDVNELKNIIISWGYDDSIASEVVRKPISYLTKSHDNELNKERSNQEEYNSYINNPDKYLIGLYYNLKNMISEFYKTKSHSVFKNDIYASNNNRCDLSEDHKSLVFGTDKSINWNSIIYGVTKYGCIGSMVVNKMSVANVDLPELFYDGDEYISVISDSCKYIIFIINGNHIYVIPKIKITTGLNTYVKLWSNEYPVQYAFGCESEDIEFTDIRGNKINVHCTDYIKSRISKPQYVSRYELKSYKKEELDIEIKA